MKKTLKFFAEFLAFGLLARTVVLSSTACGRYWVCGEVDEARVSRAPRRLSETGLFADAAAGGLAPGVMAYAPRFQLWSDGADKRRWLWLPPGTRIDTSDMDSWVFPVGTKFWKEFTRDGVRVETRLIEKLGPGDDWVALSYLWRGDQGDADAAPFGAIDAAGTPHDVPASNECAACHGGRKGFVLGFSAIQLSSPGGGLDLAALVAAGLVTAAPAHPIDVPGTDAERAALGYLHANCSHCHNQNRPERSGARCFDPESELDFSLSVSALGAPAETATYRSAVGSAVEPGRPGKSRLIELMSRRGFGGQMPPLASERVDRDAVSLLERWALEMAAP
jgi:hypothetical protein